MKLLYQRTCMTWRENRRKSCTLLMRWLLSFFNREDHSAIASQQSFCHVCSMSFFNLIKNVEGEIIIFNNIKYCTVPSFYFYSFDVNCTSLWQWWCNLFCERVPPHVFRITCYIQEIIALEIFFDSQVVKALDYLKTKLNIIHRGKLKTVDFHCSHQDILVNTVY